MDFNINIGLPSETEKYLLGSSKFKAFASAICKLTGTYNYDFENYKVINLLISYFSRSQQFENLQSDKQVLSLKKGALLLGNTGSGKTELLKCFQGLTRNLETAYSFHAANIFVYSEYHNYRDKNICIDDLGKEDFVSAYGVKIDIMSDIILARYDAFKSFGSITHFTTQLSEKQLTEKYGAHILGRLKEMCNFFPLGIAEQYTDRRLKKSPFIPQSVQDKDFPLFYPTYKTKAAQILEEQIRQVEEEFYPKAIKESELEETAEQRVQRRKDSLFGVLNERMLNLTK